MKDQCNILIIGGEGYIGNIIIQNLINNGYNITSYDNLIYNHYHSVINKMHIKNYTFVNGDMLDKEKLEKEVIKSDSVILLAGLVGDPITKKYPKESALINDKGVKNVIDICAKLNTNKFIFISTCSNYGLIRNNILADENFELNPLSHYAKSKVDAEKYLLSMKGKTEMSPTILRFATAFGFSPRMRFDLTINEFTYHLSMGNELEVYDVNTWRPYCHVQDFSRLIKIVLNEKKENISFEVFNAGGDTNNATKKMVVELILGKVSEAKIKYQTQGNDPRNYRVSFKKVKTILGFEPIYTIEDGVDEILDSIKQDIFGNIKDNISLFGNYNINYNH